MEEGDRHLIEVDACENRSDGSLGDAFTHSYATQLSFQEDGGSESDTSTGSLVEPLLKGAGLAFGNHQLHRR